MKKLLFFIPLLPVAFIVLIITLIAGAVGSPFKVIGDIFSDMGDIFDPKHDLVLMLDEYFKSDDAIYYLSSTYLESITNDKDIRMPSNYLFIPFVLNENQNPTKEEINYLINSAKIRVETEEVMLDEDGKPLLDEEGNIMYEIIIEYELKSSIKYVETIRKNTPYKKVFEGKSTENIAQYIDHFTYIDYFAPGIIVGDGEYSYPFTEKAKVTAEMGWYEPFGKLEWHDAIDLVPPGRCGVPIYSVSDGIVSNVQVASGKTVANAVTVDNQDGMKITYAHQLHPYTLPVGTQVNKGDFIGSVGSTGLSTGCHLHLNFKLNGEDVNPRLYIDFDYPFD